MTEIPPDIVNLIKIIINDFRSINVYKLKRIKNEKQFEQYIQIRLNKLIGSSTQIYLQSKSYKEGRETRPDIYIGESDILIELKYNLKGVVDIYRLYYQAIKYSKLSKYLLILCVHDPKKKLLKLDIKDLESIKKVKVVQIY